MATSLYKIYAEPNYNKPLGTAKMEHDEDESGHGRGHAWLDGFKVSGISRINREGWCAIQVNWMDKKTGRYYQPVYFNEND